MDSVARNNETTRINLSGVEYTWDSGRRKTDQTKPTPVGSGLTFYRRCFALQILVLANKECERPASQTKLTTTQRSRRRRTKRQIYEGGRMSCYCHRIIMSRTPHNVISRRRKKKKKDRNNETRKTEVGLGKTK